MDNCTIDLREVIKAHEELDDKYIDNLIEKGIATENDRFSLKMGLAILHMKSFLTSLQSQLENPIEKYLASENEKRVHNFIMKEHSKEYYHEFFNDINKN